MPGIGTAIGYAATRKKVQDTNSGSSTVKNEREEEIDSPASIVIHDVNSGENITFGFSCNTNIYNDLQNFDWDNSIPDQKTVEQDLSLQSDKVELMKKYKELLDAQVITQEEFDKKRKEILGF